MGNVMRSKAQAVPEHLRGRYTCSILGCPDQAIVMLPLNETVLNAPLANRSISPVTNEALGRDRYGDFHLKLCLCRRCVRTLATALPPGMRLAGAILRYPECDPEVKSTEELETLAASRGEADDK